jgi:excisionase family DNA binding protein
MKMSENSETCSTCSCHTTPAELPEVLTLSEAAALLRVKDHTMYYLLEHGQIKGRRVGKEYRFTRSALLAWLAGDKDDAA